MSRLIRNNFYNFLSILLLGVMFVSPAFAADEIRYNNYNIHVQSKDGVNGKASYANYTNPGEGHVILPPGTELTITDKSRKSFTFTYDAGQKKVKYEFHQSRMGMSLDEYLDIITAKQPPSLDGLSKLDRQGVAEGKPLVGMSREGVMTALGYPATHKTPSLEASTWIFWKNRFGTLAVNFDDAGKVKDVKGG